MREEDAAAIIDLGRRLTVGVAAWRNIEAVTDAVWGWVNDAVERHDPVAAPVFVAVEGGIVVGFVAGGTRTHWAGDTDAYIGELVTRSDCEERGIGTRLVGAIEDWARARGFTRITLETGAANTGAIGFYEHLGYQKEEVVLSRPLA